MNNEKAKDLVAKFKNGTSEERADWLFNFMAGISEDLDIDILAVIEVDDKPIVFGGGGVEKNAIHLIDFRDLEMPVLLNRAIGLVNERRKQWVETHECDNNIH